MATIITGEDYEKYLDHDVYVNHIYDEPDTVTQGMVDFILDSLHKSFAGIQNRKSLLDIGSGPCVHAIISASNKVDEIYMSDYSQRSIDRLNRWLKGEIDIQTKQIKYVCQLENKGQTVAEKVNQMRSKVQQICLIDITKAGSLTGCDVPKQFDVVTSCFCLDSCGQPIETYKTCATNIATLVKIGGYFVLIGTLDSALYRIKNIVQFINMDISEESVRKIYQDVGFRIMSFETHSFAIDCGKSSDTKIFCMYAQKV